MYEGISDALCAAMSEASCGAVLVAVYEARRLAVCVVICEAASGCEACVTAED